MNLRLFESVDDLVRAAARAVTQQIDAGARVIGLSGGSTPKPLYALLGEDLPAAPITWVLIDERLVPVDHPQSNAGMILSTLFARGIPENHRFLRFRTELEEPAAAFQHDIHLDLAILGVGEDGHTASLFPGTPVLDVSDRVAAMVFVPRLNAWRVTLTMPVLRSAKQAMVLAAGESKQDIVRRAREGEDLPIVRATEGVPTWWFVSSRA